MQNKRKFSRIKFVTEVQVEFNNKLYPGELMDISLNGALFYSNIEVPIKQGNACKVLFSLHPSEINLIFDAELVHFYENKLGFKFLSKDIDTMTHLRRLLELNSGDHEGITRELINVGRNGNFDG